MHHVPFWKKFLRFRTDCGATVAVCASLAGGGRVLVSRSSLSSSRCSAGPAGSATEGARWRDQRVLPGGVADLMNPRSDAVRLVLKRYRQVCGLEDERVDPEWVWTSMAGARLDHAEPASGTRDRSCAAL